jgi:hypothetical protein
MGRRALDAVAFRLESANEWRIRSPGGSTSQGCDISSGIGAMQTCSTPLESSEDNDSAMY